MTNRNITPQLILQIAHVCHEANRAYCLTLGDSSQAAWADAPEWQKASAIDGVQFHIANPHTGAGASHENWMALKASEGWVYGETKDAEARTHPCMVPFGDLPLEQQVKDHIFRSIVGAMLLGVDHTVIHQPVTLAADMPAGLVLPAED